MSSSSSRSAQHSEWARRVLRLRGLLKELQQLIGNGLELPGELRRGRELPGLHLQAKRKGLSAWGEGVDGTLSPDIRAH
jgi:hypothetical protein